MTLYNEIIKKMNTLENNEAFSNAMYRDVDEDFLPDKVTASLVCENGGEDEGSDYYAVYHFTRELEKSDTEETWIKFYGYYQSYNGADYIGHVEVQPHKVEVTQYY